MNTTKTPYSRSISTSLPLSDYPRPQLQRDSYFCLNGPWDYAITLADEPPNSWDGKILVPFSPESGLSGVSALVEPEHFLWYRRFFTLEEGFQKERVLLHFGGVDQTCRVYVNGQEAGFHSGCFLSFHFDITDFLRFGQENEILVCANDDTDAKWNTRGRQKLQPGGLWHAPQSGIWQTVWLESVPASYITQLKITPLYDEGCVEFLVSSSCSTLTGKIEIYARNTLAAEAEFIAGQPLRVALHGAISWYPHRPFLYRVILTAGEDRVESYFGMRKFSLEPSPSGRMVFHLNNKPFFQKGVLDQGYYPDGMLTPPCDAAMINDIKAAKEMGFNTLRKHGKIEPLRWYYHCDRLGVLVWQDFPSGGETAKASLSQLFFASKRNLPDHAYKRFGRESEAGRRQFLYELDTAVQHLFNSPCICTWVLFNEGWGQFDALGAANALKKLDPTRLVDHASGWHDQGGGDIHSLHLEELPAQLPEPAGRASFITQAGGYGLLEKTHFWGQSPYCRAELPGSAELEAALSSLWHQLRNLKQQGLAGFIYYQLTDVQDEISGLVTFDRQINKINPATLRRLQDTLDE